MTQEKRPAEIAGKGDLVTFVPGSGLPLINRDLSWLQFNERVLAESRKSQNPLLERAKFLAISASNLDEFFMIRFASIDRSIATHQRHRETNKAAQLEKIRTEVIQQVLRLQNEQSSILDKLAEELKLRHIKILRSEHFKKPESELGKKIFTDLVLPLCNNLEPFNLKRLYSLGSLQLAMIFPENIWCPIPKSLPSAYFVLDRDKKQVDVFFLDHLLQAHLGPAFGIKGAPGVIRLTRDGDLNFDLEEEDTESIPDLVRSEISSRERGKPMRLQFAGNFPTDFLTKAAQLLRLDPSRILPAPQTVCLQGLWSVLNQLPEEFRTGPELNYPPLPSFVPLYFRPTENPFEALKGRDLLLHYPYDSFDAFVNWIQRACEDPKVESIHMTAYRTDAVSPIIGLLKGAAKKKKIRVIIELRARFDELNNLRLAEDLRKSGVQVNFGFGRLKLHAKIALVVRREEGALRYYTQLSTGNYNAITARQYTDLSIVTADQSIGHDAKVFFDSVSQGRVPTSFKTLVSAPTRLHRLMVQRIEAETKLAREGKPARIFAKVNALVDHSIIEKLYQASNAGVLVDLVVRGACSLVPGVPGFSENIRVISIIDRFLEHSRIYYFEGAKALYLSSADWMPRNFFNRLELAYPVLDPRLHEFIVKEVIPAYLSDNTKASALSADGTWKQRVPKPGQAPLRSQFHFQELAAREYKETSLHRES